MTAAEAKLRALAAVQKLYDEAMAQSTDRYWQNGPYNVKRWSARGFGTALGELKAEPTPGETAEQYTARIGAKVHACRGLGPDEDDESWYDSAIDEAVMQIGAAARQ